MNLFLSCPPVYTLPGTWTKCDALIPHYNADPNQTFGISLLVILVLLSGYGVYREPSRTIEQVHYDDNECGDGKLAGALVGGGAAAAMSRGDGRWWAIPLGVLVGSSVGCDMAGG